MSANCKDAAGCGRETYVSNEFYISGTEAAGIRCFYFTPNVMHIMTENAMKKDFGWSVPNGSVYKYYKLFKTGSL